MRAPVDFFTLLCYDICRIPLLFNKKEKETDKQRERARETEISYFLKNQIF